MQPAALDAVPYGVRTQAEIEQLAVADGAVLASGQVPDEAGIERLSL